MRLIQILPLATVVALGACAPTPFVYSASPGTGIAQAPAPERAAGSDRHVIVISVDGLRPDAIEKFNARTLQYLKKTGTWSMDARTILPSLTLPSHTSMVTGVEPGEHGITWNRNEVASRGRVGVPTMFSVANDHGLVTAAFASKGKFHHLLAPGDLDYFVLPHDNASWSSMRTARLAGDYMVEFKPNLTFVHLREPDHYGHVFGWMGLVYGWAVRKADSAVAEVLASAEQAFGPGNYTVIVTADHGGHSRTHGTEAHSDVTIPWIAWGAGVEQAGEMDAAIRTVDTAATALWILGVAPPVGFQGRAVTAAFPGYSTKEAAPLTKGGAAPGNSIYRAVRASAP